MNIVVFDFVSLNESSATGNFKNNLFKKNNTNDYLFISRSRVDSKIKIVLQKNVDDIETIGYFKFFRKIKKFNPDLFIHRPAPNDHYLEFLLIICLLIFKKNYILIFYDSWFKISNTSLKKLNNCKLLLKNCIGILTISKELSNEVKKFFGVDTLSLELKNSLKLKTSKKTRNKISNKIIYSGSINPIMNADVIYSFALAVEKSKKNIEFDIYPNNLFPEQIKKFLTLEKTNILNHMDHKDYYETISQYTYGLIPYSFQEKALNYNSYSFSNKLHQYLHTNISIIGIGPRNNSTINFLIENNFKNIIFKDELDSYDSLLNNLHIESDVFREDIIKKHFDLLKQHEKLDMFYKILNQKIYKLNRYDLLKIEYINFKLLLKHFLNR